MRKKAKKKMVHLISIIVITKLNTNRLNVTIKRQRQSRFFFLKKEDPVPQEKHFNIVMDKPKRKNCNHVNTKNKTKQKTLSEYQYLYQTEQT